MVRLEDGLWVCGECGLAYRIRELAERCEAWCREHGSCNLDIIRNAVPRRRCGC